MREKTRQYLTLLRHRRGFVIGLAIVLCVAVLCELAADTDLFWSAGRTGGRALASGFGDAFIIAFVLALLVDPLAQHQFATEWGRDLYWAIFSPNAPQDFRDALQNLAAPTGYIKRCTYELQFIRSDQNDAKNLRFYMRVSISGVTLDRRGFRPVDPVFVSKGHAGTPSHYRHWSFEGDDIDRVEYNEDEMSALGALSHDEGGRTMLNQSLLTNDRSRVPFNGKYSSERHVEVVCAPSDYFPLFQARIVLNQVVVIKGAAVEDLDFSLVQLGSTQIPAQSAKRPDGKLELRFETSTVAFPGQASLLSWKPKAIAEPVG